MAKRHGSRNRGQRNQARCWEGKAGQLEVYRAVTQGVLGNGIDLASGGCMGYRILTDQVLNPFGYNKPPPRIEFY